MKRLLIMSIICVLFFSTCTVFALQVDKINASTEKSVAIITNTSKTDINQTKAIVHKGLSDYLSGKTGTLNLPGFKEYDGPVYPGNVMQNVLPPKPDSNNGTFIGYANAVSSTGQIITNSLGLLPIKHQDSDPAWPYSNTYIMFGGADDVLYDRTKNAISINADIDTTLLNNMVPGNEIFVLHFWGNNTLNMFSENNIVISKSDTLPNTIDFTFYISSYNNRYGHGNNDSWVETIHIPAGHQVSIYIVARNLNGLYYQLLECGLLDMTTDVSYRRFYNLPYTHVVCTADITLERGFSPNEPADCGLNLMRTATNLQAYDQNVNVMNLCTTGEIIDMVCYYPTGSGILRCHNGYSYQLNPYFGTPNGDGQFTIWRY